MGSLNN